MAAPPVPYWADSNTQQYTPSFPPPVYYRDTFGLGEGGTGSRRPSTQSVKKGVKRTHPQQEKPATLTYPPPLYYRDTFGLEPAEEHLRVEIRDHQQQQRANSVDSDETNTTKSTVRHPIRIFHPSPSLPGPSLNRLLFGQRRKSGFSGVSNQATAGGGGLESAPSEMSQSFQITEMLSTDQVLLIHKRPLLWLSSVAFGAALQLLVFSTVCVFFDGHWIGIGSSVFLLIQATMVLVLLQRIHSRLMLLICIALSILAFFISVALFFFIAYLIHVEDVRIRNDNFDFSSETERSNQIVQNARIGMYSLQLIYAPICAVCTFSITIILWRNQMANKPTRTQKGFFLTKPANGHQRVLVPIKLRQVSKIEEVEERGKTVLTNELVNMKNGDTIRDRQQRKKRKGASVAVQTSMHLAGQ